MLESAKQSEMTLRREVLIRVQSLRKRVTASFHDCLWALEGPRVHIVLLALVVSVGPCILLIDWLLARSVFTGFVSLLPTWDSHYYYRCANVLLDRGTFGAGFSSEMCNWRPIYSSLFSALTAVSGRNLHITLILQATVVSISLALLMRELARWIGVLGAAIALIPLIVYASRYCFPNVMTENAGLAFGAMGLALLLRGAGSTKPWLCFVGMAILSVALNARAGCFFVLPLLIIWAAIYSRIPGRSILFTLFWAVGAVAAGFILNSVLIALNGMPMSDSNSNFAFTLYGLAVGGKGWTQAKIDHPGLDRFAVYQLALQTILSDPILIVRALLMNLLDCLRNGLGLFGGYVRGLGYGFWGLWIAGFAAIAAQYRDPRYSLIGVLTLGGLLSGPIIVQDGGARVFAATVPADAVQMALGFGLIYQRIVGSAFLHSPVRHTDLAVPYFAVGFAVLLIVAAVAPYSPLRQFAALPELNAAACPESDKALLTRLGRETVAVNVVSNNDRVQIYPPRVPLKSLMQSLPDTEQTKRAFVRPVPYSLLLAYQRNGSDDDYGALYALIWSADLTPLYGKVIQVCFHLDQVIQEDYPWTPVYVAKSVTALNAQVSH